MGVLRTHFMAEVGEYRFFGFCSDLDQNRAVLWSKSEHETPETPETLETLETPETLFVDVRSAFLSTFQRTRWQS